MAMKNSIVYSTFFLTSILILASSFSGSKPSELAKLMKQMQSYIEKEKMRLADGEKQEPLTVSLQKVLKSKATKGKKLSHDHEQYARDFYEQYNRYIGVADMQERKQVFNLLVNSCINCHKHECPGPIVRIEKSLYHNAKEQ